ncbi:MAG TPA: hypothetical protein VE981_19025 [Planctomycetota bacterium]|nr:hypothetical protein [Planctomycetota bacterium]
MNALFRAFERERVRFLLIGGQAAILDGAAHFTQDLDLWIRPDRRNLDAFLRALARVGALLPKLTPPLSLRWLGRGHGFPFVSAAASLVRLSRRDGPAAPGGVLRRRRSPVALPPHPLGRPARRLHRGPGRAQTDQPAG